jgi:hypothetical protein
MSEIEIVNPGFEDGFYRDGDDALLLGNGWKAWWAGTRPEWKPNQEQQWVHGGEFSQKIMLPWKAWQGGIWQRVTVERGKWYKLSGWLYAHTAPDDNEYRFQSGLGINPYGNAPTDAYTHWWAATWNVDQWTQRWALAKAFSNTITVCVRGEPSFDLEWNDLFIDDLALEEIAGPGETPPEPPPEPEPGGPTIEAIRAVVREELDNTGLGVR